MTGRMVRTGLSRVPPNTWASPRFAQPWIRDGFDIRPYNNRTSAASPTVRGSVFFASQWKQTPTLKQPTQRRMLEFAVLVPSILCVRHFVRRPSVKASNHLEE